MLNNTKSASEGSPGIQLLERENTGLLVVDVQEKLVPVIERGEWLIGNILKLLHLAELFSLPVILTEHHVRWLGPTLPEITGSVPGYDPITKMHFNCCDVDSAEVVGEEVGRNEGRRESDDHEQPS